MVRIVRLVGNSCHAHFSSTSGLLHSTTLFIKSIHSLILSKLYEINKAERVLASKCDVGKWIFSKLGTFSEIVRNFLGFFWEFWGDFFGFFLDYLEEFFGKIFWEDFLWRIFLGGSFWEDFWEDFFGRNCGKNCSFGWKFLSRSLFFSLRPAAQNYTVLKKNSYTFPWRSLWMERELVFIFVISETKRDFD